MTIRLLVSPHSLLLVAPRDDNGTPSDDKHIHNRAVRNHLDDKYGQDLEGVQAHVRKGMGRNSVTNPPAAERRGRWFIERQFAAPTAE